MFFFLQAVLLCGRKFIDEGHGSSDEIKARCDQLQENWDELKNLAEQRQHKLDESLAYQQFSANVGEEESWINEKNTLVGSDDYGDTLAAVQVRQQSTDPRNTLSQNGNRNAFMDVVLH